MKLFTFLLLSFCTTSICKAQIDSVESLERLIHLLKSRCTLGSFQYCSDNCWDCNFLLKDSTKDPMESRFHGPPRLVGACKATYLLVDLYQKDSILLSKLQHFDAEFKKMDGPESSLNYLKLSMAWYEYYDEQLLFYRKHNGMVYSGYLLQQLEIAHLLMDAKLKELEGIEEIFYFIH